MKNQRLHVLADHPHHAARIEVHRPRTQPDLMVTQNAISHERSGVALVHCCYRHECGAEGTNVGHWAIWREGRKVASGLVDLDAVSDVLRGWGIMWPPLLPGFGERGASGQVA